MANNGGHFRAKFVFKIFTLESQKHNPKTVPKFDIL